LKLHARAIAILYWDQISKAAPKKQQHAIWPGPIDFDECFQKAGFAHFADTDQAWHDDWADLIRASFDVLALEFGDVAFEDFVPAKQARWIPRLIEKFSSARNADDTTAKALRALYLASIDDSFGQASLSFGPDQAASLHTKDGHPILWITTDKDSTFVTNKLLSKVAKAIPLESKKLEWSHLK